MFMFPDVTWWWLELQLGLRSRGCLADTFYQEYIALFIVEYSHLYWLPKKPMFDSMIHFQYIWCPIQHQHYRTSRPHSTQQKHYIPTQWLRRFWCSLAPGLVERDTRSLHHLQLHSHIRLVRVDSPICHVNSTIPIFLPQHLCHLLLLPAFQLLAPPVLTQNKSRPTISPHSLL